MTLGDSINGCLISCIFQCTYEKYGSFLLGLFERCGLRRLSGRSIQSSILYLRRRCVGLKLRSGTVTYWSSLSELKRDTDQRSRYFIIIDGLFLQSSWLLIYSVMYISCTLLTVYTFVCQAPRDGQWFYGWRKRVHYGPVNVCV